MTTTALDPAAIAPGLANAGCPLDGVATAGIPRAEHYARFAAAGYRTVLDLCAPEEARGYDEARVVAEAGLTYLNIPVRSSTPADATFDRVRAVLRDPARRPLLFHCRSANRVGGLLLPSLILDEGMSEEQAVPVAGRVGLRNADLRRAALDYVARHRTTISEQATG